MDIENKLNKVRLRFAPSPTGFLHIGNLRTALFGYFLAKSQNGLFILRLEDTDQEREVAGALESLLKIFSWLDIKFDEGPHKKGEYAPYIQSKRLDKYKLLAKELVEKGAAYPCFCTPERLEKMRQKQQAKKLPPRYDRHCRSLSKKERERKIKNGEKFVIRQKMPLKGEVEVFDEIRGKIKFSASDLDDHVLIKSNGIPTYQFANIVDDHLMAISLVSRGDEWLPSFPKNILLYQAFGWQPPKFIHLPLILNKTGGKLSKRQGNVSVEEYRQKGYLPEALINFCALLGWHPKNNKEILSKTEIETEFSLKGISASPAIFDEEKLNYLNGYYIRQKSLPELVKLCQPYLKLKKNNIKDLNQEKIKKIVTISQERMKKLSDIKELSLFLFSLPSYKKELLPWKELTLEKTKLNLEEIYNFWQKITEKNWSLKYLEKETLSWIKKKSGKNGDYLWPLRVALSGLKNSPSPFEIAWTLEKKESLKRIKKGITKL
jgi:glutamyl-tRNA synthetase